MPFTHQCASNASDHEGIDYLKAPLDETMGQYWEGARGQGPSKYIIPHPHLESWHPQWQHELCWRMNVSSGTFCSKVAPRFYLLSTIIAASENKYQDNGQKRTRLLFSLQTPFHSHCRTFLPLLSLRAVWCWKVFFDDNGPTWGNKVKQRVNQQISRIKKDIKHDTHKQPPITNKEDV